MTEIAFHFLPLIAVIAYGAAVFELVRDLVAPGVQRPRRRFLVLGFVCHVAFLGILLNLTSQEPGVFSFAETLAIISAALVAGLLLPKKYHSAAKEKEAPANRRSFLGAFVLPIALLFFLLSSVVFHVHRDVQPVENPNIILWVHILLAIAGHVALAFACAVSIALVLSDWCLKTKRLPAFLRKLPSLAALDELNGKLIYWAVFSMFLSMVIGVSFGFLFQTSVFQIDSRVMWTGGIVSFLFFVLVLRESHGIRGRFSALLTISGFVLVLLSFAQVGLGGGSFHVH